MTFRNMTNMANIYLCCVSWLWSVSCKLQFGIIRRSSSFLAPQVHTNFVIYIQQAKKIVFKKQLFCVFRSLNQTSQQFWWPICVCVAEWLKRWTSKAGTTNANWSSARSESAASACPPRSHWPICIRTIIAWRVEFLCLCKYYPVCPLRWVRCASEPPYCICCLNWKWKPKKLKTTSGFPAKATNKYQMLC